MSLFGSFFDSMTQTQAQVDAKRREDLLYAFQAAHVAKTYKREWHPTRLGTASTRTYPNIVIDNWAAAFKVRAHYEEVVEKRKAAGKPVY